MSTLTSSPSPAASPRPRFAAHYGVSQRPTKSPRIPPFTSPVVRPHAPGPANTIASTTPPRLLRTPASKPQTADAGTQYTPEGLPPTASQTAGSKRKDPSDSSPMKREPTSDEPIPPPPNEPQLESQPPTSAPTNGQPSATSLPTTAAQPAGPSTAEDAAQSPSASKRPRTADNTKLMPIKYETCNPKDLGYLISNMLMELIRLNDKIPINGRLTRFHSRAPPGITCHDYLQRLIQHATLSPPILLSMVYYIDRLCALYPAFNVSSLTVHRFLITAATVASKGLSDSFWTNPTYARIGGITTGELATLEMEFLQKTEWRIVPKPEVLVDYYVSLVERNEGYALEAAHVGGTTDADGAMDTDPT